MRACLLGLIFLLPAWSWAASDTLRCGTRLIDNNSSQSRILEYCGEPAYKRDGVRKIYLRNQRGHIYGETHIRTEEWIYDRGSTQFRAILSFENGKLQRIEYEP